MESRWKADKKDTVQCENEEARPNAYSKKDIHDTDDAVQRCLRFDRIAVTAAVSAKKYHQSIVPEAVRFDDQPAHCWLLHSIPSPIPLSLKLPTSCQWRCIH